jgi:predicted MFS family arabinose efflux permease
MLAGRFLTGAALDRFDPYAVSFITLGLPSIGLFIFASSLDSPGFLTLSSFLLGFAFGAEGDIVAYLVSRSFGVAVYSSVMGLVTGAISASAAGGAALLSLTMGSAGDFDRFLQISGTTVLVGAALLLTLRRAERVRLDHALA